MKIIQFKEIDSTSAYIKREHQNLNDLTFVCAEYQTNGKGRENRVWSSNNNENLLFSFLIKDQSLLREFKKLSILSSCIIYEYLTLLGIKNVSIKWPNDVYVNDKKICGILLEGQIEEYISIGIGLNVNTDQFIGEFRVPPTSMFLEKNMKYDLEALKGSLFEFICKYLEMFKNGLYEPIRTINEHNYLLGKTVNYNNNCGIVVSINEDGSICIKNSEMDIINISSGEIE